MLTAEDTTDVHERLRLAKRSCPGYRESAINFLRSWVVRMDQAAMQAR